jgi:hypothetical protein
MWFRGLDRGEGDGIHAAAVPSEPGEKRDREEEKRRKERRGVMGK